MLQLPIFNQVSHGFRSVRIPNGALGAGVNISPAVNEIWSPSSIFFTLHTSLAVADRFLIVAIGDTPNFGFKFQSSVPIFATQFRNVNLFVGANPEYPVDPNASWQISIPHDTFVQFPNYITLGGQGLDVNDQFTGININFRLWTL